MIHIYKDELDEIDIIHIYIVQGLKILLNGFLDLSFN